MLCREKEGRCQNMKLRGTLTEQAFRKELQASKNHLFNDKSMLRA